MSRYDHEPGETREFASSPCYAHEFERGSLAGTALIDFLNGLLEGERAGASGLNDLAKRATDAALSAALLDVARDEGRYCVMLRAHIRRLGGSPSDATGVFYDKLMARDGLKAQLDLLDRGQRAVVRALDDALPRIADVALHADLGEMRETHVQNIARCAALEAAR